MFRNILVPTDGSELSQKAAAQAVAIAKATGAGLTAFHVAAPYVAPVMSDGGSTMREVVSRKDYEARVSTESELMLDAVRNAAAMAGVRCDARYKISDSAADAIVHAAQEYDCDGIVMGSHGRSGLKKLLLGSVAQKTLVSTKLPVLVVH